MVLIKKVLPMSSVYCVTYVRIIHLLYYPNEASKEKAILRFIYWGGA